MIKLFTFTIFVFSGAMIFAQQVEEQPWQGKFEQIDNLLPTPNVYRTGDGSPGPSYWQQKADYDIKIALNDAEQKIVGSQKVTYTNNSPNPLRYIWLQLDQNKRSADSERKLIQTGRLRDSVSTLGLVYFTGMTTTIGGINITSLTDRKGAPLDYTIVKTMLRINLPEPLMPGKEFVFNSEWWYYLNDRMEDHGRSGYEYFPEDDNYLYTIGQFYPRLAVYDDFNGWQHKQFLGVGEFALTFGDFHVEISVPADHVVAATGELKNANKVLSSEQNERFQQAFTSYESPVMIVNQEQATANESSRSKEYKTWIYEAQNVRDFAFASSRKFIWEAQGVKLNGKTVLAMSFYPKEGNPLWELESTKAIIHTLKTYSRYSVDYPYPVAISIHAASIGMEYPMICFNKGRPKPDGSYTEAVKYEMITVVVHEVGHNFFPMIINSDERQWAWMDEGINSFLEYLTKDENYENFPHSMGPPSTIVPYMKGNKKYIRPMMTNPEQLMQLGYNAYGKPAAAFTILREVVLGRELFDYAFKAYSEKWAFKHPKPADFFRTMEDASGVDLDWFWRGWFYTVDHVDVAIDTVIQGVFLPQDAGVENFGFVLDTSAVILTKNLKLKDTPKEWYGEFRNELDYDEVYKKVKGYYYCNVKFSNLGGLVTPLIVRFTFEDGSTEEVKIPAEIWRMNEYKATKIFKLNKPVVKVELDPMEMTADVDLENNVYPREVIPSEFDEMKEE
ncbi:MAG: M1 family metallopeptidase [Crocinitomicaceae bacterium]|nr:M1 family metallopeptidase [Crocinitomicaceae bacterium]